MNENDKTEGTPLIVPDQSGEWGDDTRIVEPGVQTEDGKTIGAQPDAPEVEEVEDDTEVEEVEVLVPVATLADPGEFKPADYSFEVTVYDEEGKNGKVVKVKSVDDWDELLAKDVNLGSAQALMRAERAATKMESSLDRDQLKWQEKKEAFEVEQKTLQAQSEATNQMVSEITYLVEKGYLPKVSAKDAKADWNDPEVAKHPGVKEQVALLSYMKKESNLRVKAGLKPLASIIDAFNAYQLDQTKKQALNSRQQAAEARKVAGAQVAGSSPSPVSSAPKGIMVGRGGSLRDLSNSGW